MTIQFCSLCGKPARSRLLQIINVRDGSLQSYDICDECAEGIKNSEEACKKRILEKFAELEDKNEHDA